MILPFIVKPFDILFDKQISRLYLDERQVGDSPDCMFNTFLDRNRIASANNRPDIIEYQFSFAVDKRSDFIAMAV